MRRLVHFALPILFAVGSALLQAQTRTDSLDQALALIAELVEAENFEDAQVEAANLREYLQRRALPCPAESVPLLLDIYQKNRDKKSAREFLDEARAGARNQPDESGRVELLAALADGYAEWNRPENALACLRKLIATRDSLAERERRADLLTLQTQLDSLKTLRYSDIPPSSGETPIPHTFLLAIGGGALAIILLLLYRNRRAVRRWRKLVAKRELEIDFLRSERFADTFSMEPVALETTMPVPPSGFEQNSHARPGNHRPDKTALLIEPNRQIVLYLKSLLADRFEVETATTAGEGLLAASNHLPDLIVCDAVLNGQTGIDVVRQIKLAERTNHIPVILLTERYGSEGKLDALRAGADAWFARPVLDRELDSSVTLLLDAHQKQHAEFARFLHLYFSENRIQIGDPFLARVVSHIEQNLSDPDFMADDLARKMQLHKQHFFKKLHVLTGKEPAQLLREMRLEKARSLLEIRAGTPQTIAELVGFSSAGTFALAFKEYFGENTLLLRMPGKES